MDAAPDDDVRGARLAAIAALLEAEQWHEARGAALAFIAELDAVQEPDERVLIAGAHARFLAGRASWLLDENDNAERHYRDALVIYREISDRRGEANALLGLGHVLLGRDEGEAAERHYRDALAIYREIGEVEHEVDALIGVAEVRLAAILALLEADKWREALDAALTLAEELDSVQEPNERVLLAGARARVLAGQASWLLDEDKEAERLFRHALVRFRQVGHPQGEAIALLGVANSRLAAILASLRASLWREALDAALALVAELDPVQEPDERVLCACARALQLAGEASRLLNDNNEAERYYRRALELFRAINHPLGEANALDGIGRIRLAAIVAFLQASLCCEALDAAHALIAELEAVEVPSDSLMFTSAQARFLAGQASWCLDENEEAERYYRQALDLHRQIGDMDGVANARDAIARIRMATVHTLLQASLLREALDAALALIAELDAVEEPDQRVLLVSAQTRSLAGQASWRLDESEEAERLFRQALDICRQIDFRQGEASALLGLAYALRQRDENEEAERLLRQALDLCRQIDNRQGEASALLGLAHALRERDENEEAERLFRQALDLCRQIDYRQGEASALLGLAYALRERDENEEAERLFRQALDLCRQIDYRQGEASALLGLAYALRQRDENEEAERLFRQALDLSGANSHKQDEASALLGLADALRGRGENDEAERLFRQALDLCRQIDYRQGEANAIVGLADALRGRGENDEAERLFRQALDLCRQIDYRQGEANAIVGLADVLRMRGQVEAAEWTARQALDLCRQIEDRQGEANALLGLAEALRVRYGNQEAERNFRQALDLYRQVKDRRGEANALVGLGNLLRGRNDNREAGHLFGQALDLHRQLAERQGEANALLGLAVLAPAGEDTHAHLLRAARLYHRLGDPNEALALGLGARLGVETGRAAWRHLRRAIAVIERLAGRFETPESHITHGLRWEQVFEQAMLNRLEARRIHQAFEVHARYQGRLLVEVAASGPGASIDRHPDTTLRTAYAAAETHLDELEEELRAVRDARLAKLAASLPGSRIEAELAVLHSSPQLVALSEQLDRAQLERLTLLRQARVTSPPVEPPTVSTPVSYRALRDAVTAQGVALVSFAWSESVHGFFVLLPNRPVRFVPFDDAAVGEIHATLADLAAVAFPERDEHGNTRRPDLVADHAYWRQCLDDLRAVLWAPVAAAVRNLPVRVVPDGPLAIVPFGALHGAADVRLLPGPSYLLVEPQPAATGFDVLALGANADRDLRGTEVDLEAVQSIFGKAAEVHGTGDDPAGSLLRSTGAYRYLFTSSHVYDGTVRVPGIRLSKPGVNGAPVGRLVTVPELLALQSRFEGVVLSGCAGLLPGGGPDLLSVGAALLAATGARLVVSTLWPVSDVGATLLALELLPRLHRGEPLAPALTASGASLRALTKRGLPGYLRGIQHLVSRDSHDWLSTQLDRLAMARRDSDQLLPPGDLLAWTTLGG